MDIAAALSLFVDQPWWALAVAAPLLALFAWQKLQPLLVAGLAWLVYFAYELMLFHGLICPEGCNIRIELLLIYPMLLSLSLRALWALGKHLRRKSPS